MQMDKYPEQCTLKYNNKGVAFVVKDPHQTRIMLKQFSFAFLVLFIGYLISIVQFFREKMHHHFYLQRQRQLQKQRVLEARRRAELLRQRELQRQQELDEARRRELQRQRELKRQQKLEAQAQAITNRIASIWAL